MDVQFREMMAAFPTGVSVVTAHAGDACPCGMTCSSLCSLSVDPPSLLVCLRAQSPTLAAVVGGGVFAVNLLHADAQPVAVLFASGAPDRFDRVAWSRTPGTGSPALIEAAHTIADCAVDRVHPAGDHVIVVGLVQAVQRLRDHSALLYGFRQYSHWAHTPAPVA